MDYLTAELLTPLFALIASLLFGLIRKYSERIDTLPAITKQLLVTLLVGLVMFTAKIIGFDSGDPSTWTDETIRLFIGALLAFGFNSVKTAITKGDTPST